jgi:hypothetical protein
MSRDSDEIDFNLDDDDDIDALFDTPGKPKPTSKAPADASEDVPIAAAPRARSQSRQSMAEARETALQRELENVRGVNKVIEGVVESLEKAKENMGVSLERLHRVGYADDDLNAL